VVISEAAFEFELSGGNLCLDFINTVSDRAGEPREHVETYGDLLEFARQAGAMPPAEVEELAAEATSDPAYATRVNAQALRTREVLYRIFRTIATENMPGDRDLAALNSILVDGLAKARLIREGDAYLASGRLDRIRLCGSDTCEWLFLDESRNRSRRWCDMSTCGNREKARRHYEKARARG
jgi:predicted RNA-binding Zn ribbon-like protein